MPADRLTTTSYAVLGLLALRDWSSYELANQMERGLGQVWPRARSKIFEEPKKLVRLGLATADDDPVGQRPRTTYSITDAGRLALRAWLAEPGDGPLLEFEAMVQVFFAEHAGRDELLATLRGIDAWAAARERHNTRMAREYVDGSGPFPERLPMIVLMGTFLTAFADAVGEWARWAQQEVAGWPDDLRRAPVPLDRLRDVAGRPLADEDQSSS